ncbi:MAG: phosphatase PAP2 family protein [Burkholderiales bacterium]|nr:phosphatase PAP2 family protein [Burkholderiales bacterium]
MTRASSSRLAVGLRALAVLDAAWCLHLNRALRIRPLRLVLRAASRLGDGVFWYVLMAALVATQGRAALPAVLHMALVGALGVAVYKWLKRHTSRPRPYQVQQAIRRGAPPLDAHSFPSGHTMHAASFSIVAASYYPELAWLVTPFSVLVAASRPVLGLHYPSDVLAGAGLGAAIAGASLLLI